jgi:hypothetical protein
VAAGVTGWVDSRALRRYVVRLAPVDGRGVGGTGFFAAPGCVLTCAHVIRDAETMSVTPELGLAVAVGTSWLGRVVARSAAGGPGLWPFPDLAVLRLNGAAAHPVVRLSGEDPAGDVDCHTWGFLVRDREDAVHGSPVSFRFEGVEGDGYFKLKAGQAMPGLSGAPLICPVRRAVVGVITGTRDKTSDLGGFASPIAALLCGGDGVPEALVRAGRQIQAATGHRSDTETAAWDELFRQHDVDSSQPAVRPYAPTSPQVVQQITASAPGSTAQGAMFGNVINYHDPRQGTATSGQHADGAAADADGERR